MAPTVCSEKKGRVSGMKEVRRRSNMGVAHANASTSASPAAGATQNNVVLSVAKGSMNFAGRLQRRRGIRLPPRLQHHAKSVASTSTPADDGQRESKSKQIQLMEFMGYNESSTQIARTHSSSNVKTVLQPTMANSNSSNWGSNKTTAKLCVHASDMEEDDDGDDEEEDQGDGDSGYEFSLGPMKLPYHHQQQQQQMQQQQQQYHTHNEGLLSIAIKTIKLVQRNKLLQKRLAQLQLETSEFIASVLANPENRHFREKIKAKTDAANKVSNVLLRH